MSIETYIPTLTERERQLRHPQPIEVTPEPGKPTVGELIKLAVDSEESTITKLAQAARLSRHCVRNLRDDNCDGQKTVNYETARSLAEALGYDDPYQIQWPCPFGDQGRPHVSTGSLPIVDVDTTIRYDDDDPYIYYVGKDAYCRKHGTPLYTRGIRRICDDCE